MGCRCFSPWVFDSAVSGVGRDPPSLGATINHRPSPGVWYTVHGSTLCGVGGRDPVGIHRPRHVRTINHQLSTINHLTVLSNP